MSVTEKVKREVFERDNESCVLCHSMVDLEPPHHCFWKSKYHGDDRDKAFNLVTICVDCHRGRVHNGDRRARRECEKMAYDRASDETKEKLKILTPDICED